MYTIPREYYFRLHHIRPRFKDNLENVLLFVSNEISELSQMPKDEFDELLDNALRNFPGNRTKTSKTIANWRTEISALFGFLLYDSKNKMESPSSIVINLSEKQDLVEFFKIFCYTFQYPGGHLKSHENKKIIESGIKFRPVKYLLNLLHKGSIILGKDFSITKAEATHCIFNDLRVTRDQRSIEETLKLILKNRKEKINYDNSGDVIRYAGDFLDYMYYGNLLIKLGNYYAINNSEMNTIMEFIDSDLWYTGYENFYDKQFDVSEINSAQMNWFFYLNELSDNLKFGTDVLDFVSINKQDYEGLSKTAHILSTEKLFEEEEAVSTKNIGDTGESLAHGHECMRLKIAGRDDLVLKVVCIPNQLKMGYDIRSFETDGQIRCIEVKTTISNSTINTMSFHLTENEWNIAQNENDRYYIYRIFISRGSISLFIIKNPVQKYREGLLSITLKNGALVKINETAGNYEKLLIWKN